MSRTLAQPDTAKVSRKRAAAILTRLGQDWATEVMVRLPAPPIVPQSLHAARDWAFGAETVVSYIGEEENFPTGKWACDCTPYTPAQCEHVATLIVVHAWHDESLKPLFEQPAWALALENLTRSITPGQINRDGMVIQYHLLPDGEGLDGLPLRRVFMRRSRRDGRPLRPLKKPNGLDELIEKHPMATESDRRIHAAADERRWLGRLSSATDRETVRPIIDRHAANIFSALLFAENLLYDGEPIEPDTRPYTPLLVATDCDEGVALAWDEPVKATWAIGPGYVLTEDGAFREMTPYIQPGTLESLLAALPVIPTDEIEQFLTRFVNDSAVAMHFDSVKLPQTVAPDSVMGRVRLAEVSDGLEVTLRIGYRVGDDETDLAPEDRRRLCPLSEVLVVRDLAQEDALSRALAAVIGEQPPAVIREENAMDFLLDARRQLGMGWVFFGDEALLNHRVRGTLSARVQVPSGVDWFDLQVAFELDGQQATAGEVLQSWAQGRRYHRLSDGTLARLPTEWLERYGQVSAELEELRDSHGRLRAHAAPLVVSLLDQAEGDVVRWHELAARLRGVSGVPDVEPPANLKADLRDYQKSGYRWLRFLRDLGLGGCLADDMGLGKTVQAIAILLDTHTGEHRTSLPSLVVAPTSVVHNWWQELRRFAPDLTVKIHHGPQRGDGSDFDQIDVIITSYPLLRHDRALFLERRWCYAILDEAQQVKNPTSQVAKTAHQLDARHRLALSGTPLENRLIELWSIFDFLMPGFFGTRASFQRRYAAPIEKSGDQEAITGLQRRIRPFVLRRLKSEVAKELPPRQEQILVCELGTAQRALYERVKATYRNTVMGRVRTEGVGRSALSVLEALMRLRQACCDPELLPFPEAREVRSSAKLDLLMETLDKTVAAGHRTLVFSQWPSLLRIVSRRLETRGWTWLYLDGSTTRRHLLVDRWNDPSGPPVFLISLKAGGAGLNLTGADHVIHLDPWWNPAVEDQATDRAHRIGQTKPVVAYRLVARDTVEEKILELQARKRALFKSTIENNRTVVEQLTVADLEAVFAPRPDEAELEPLYIEPKASKKSRNVGTPARKERKAGNVDSLMTPGARLTNETVREHTGWPADRARRWLQDQVGAGRLEQRGRKRGTHYVVCGT